MFAKILQSVKTFMWQHIVFVLAFVVVSIVAVLLYVGGKGSVANSLMEALFAKFGHTKAGPNTVPKGRKEAIGEADKEGFVQQQVQDLKVSSNPFRDKTSVTLPDGEKVKLPTGLQDKDVDTIIESKATVTVTPDKQNAEKATDTQKVLDTAQKTAAATQALLDQLKGK